VYIIVPLRSSSFAPFLQASRIAFLAEWTTVGEARYLGWKLIVDATMTMTE